MPFCRFQNHDAHADGEGIRRNDQTGVLFTCQPSDRLRNQPNKIRHFLKKIFPSKSNWDREGLNPGDAR